MKKLFPIFFLSLFTFTACEELGVNKSDELTSENLIDISDYLTIPSTPYNYSDIDVPDFFNLQPNTEQDNTPNNNEVTDWGATLGRVLFYDKVLSANNTTSCSSCHLQASGFSDPNQLSIGFEVNLLKPIL